MPWNFVEGMRRIRGMTQGRSDPVKPGTPTNPAYAELERALSIVTNSSNASVSQEALGTASDLARQSDGAVALTLRHLEDGLSLPPADWRRVHGTLHLLTRLLRPVESQGPCCNPVGSIWFEAKARQRLKELTQFEYSEDQRVAVIIRRAAGNALEMAARHLKDGAEDEISTIPDSVDGRPRSFTPSDCSDTSESHSFDGETVAQPILRESDKSQCSRPAHSEVPQARNAATTTIGRQTPAFDLARRPSGRLVRADEREESQEEVERMAAAFKQSLQKACNGLNALCDESTLCGALPKEPSLDSAASGLWRLRSFCRCWKRGYERVSNGSSEDGEL